MNKDNPQNILRSIADNRPKTMGSLSGPIPFFGLVVMVCELSLAITNAFISNNNIQWFLVISMVLILSLSVAGFFHLIINHHEKLYPPGDYPDEIVKDVFRNKSNTISPINNADVSEFIKLVLTSTNMKYTISDLLSVANVHFNTSSQYITPALQNMLDNKSLLVREDGGETFVYLPVSSDSSDQLAENKNEV